jgi:hypothetical protein
MAKPKGSFKRPPGPRAGTWSWRHLDVWKTMKMINSQRVRTRYENFPDAVPVGSEFPEVELTDTEGGTINTRDFKGQRHFVLWTGAIT